MATPFQRARTAEQRAERRCAILRTAAAMLAEMPVADLSLNELSRRVGLAKSNVLRYFESREAVLLELLDSSWRDWAAALAAELPAAVDPGAPAAERIERVAEAVAASLAARPVLCDLLSAQAAVLERNVSTEVAIRYKRASLANVGALATCLRDALPELAEPAAVRLAAGILLVTAPLWSHAQPTPAVLAAYEAAPEVAVLRLDFTDALREAVATLTAGVLARQ